MGPDGIYENKRVKVLALRDNVISTSKRECKVYLVHSKNFVVKP